MFWLIETAIVPGLLLLTGHCLFSGLAGAIAGANTEQKNPVETRIRTTLVIGLLLFTAGSLAKQQDLLFMTGQIMLAAVVFVAGVAELRHRPAGARLIAVAGSLGLVFLHTVSSHAVTEAGLLPAGAQFLHTAAAAVWAGGALHALLRTWPMQGGPADSVSEQTQHLVRRYATVSLLVLGVLALTGGLLAFVHIHNLDALNTSAYGSAFIAKIGISATLIITVSVNCLRVVPALNPVTGAAIPQYPLRTFRRLLTVEASLLVLVTVSSTSMASRQPVGFAPFLNPQSWTIDAEDTRLRVELQPVAGRSGRARFEISAEETDFKFPDGTLATLTVLTANGTVGEEDIEAIPIGPAAFLAESVLAIPGNWEFMITMNFPDGGSRQFVQPFTLPEPPLQKDMFASLRASTVTYSRTNLATFLIGLLLIVIAAWSVRLSMQKRAPGWLMPAALFSMTVGGYLGISVSFVKTYPSSFWPNPEPFTAAAIRAGEPIFQTHCAECHGVAGLGDGDWAIINRGSIPDLTAPHMDSHTDGEIYWWIRHGIPSLQMPALGDELSEAEIWTAINFVRGLRHRPPPES